ncbi:MAG TPA: tail fiber domain-containing protein [Steroidobacteraceae bacterium]|nr:tail fiber domain-containing protein [Steroidobacteraceae bacterium]
MEKRNKFRVLAALVVASSLFCLSRADAQALTGAPIGGYITFNLAPGASSAPITPPADVPVLVMGSVTTGGFRGVGQVVMERESGAFLQWVGLNSNENGTITESYSGTAGTNIVQIDYSGDVYLVVNGTDSFVVTNSASSSYTATGYVSWTYFSNATLGNSLLGNNALSAVTTGYQNTAIGNNALPADTTGYNNTAIGAGALYENVNGDENSAGGVGTMQHNTSGSNNTGWGYSALWENTSGASNVGVGWNALEDNTTGSNNTAVGTSALVSALAASGNTAVGAAALTTNNGSTGYNTAVGYHALVTDPSGNYSTAVGAYSLASVTAASIGYNTGFGAFTLNANTGGSNNTAFGYAALRSTSTGNNNIGFGYQALYLDASGSNNIAMGYQAAYNVASGSNTIEIGSAGAAADNNLIRIGTQGVQTEAIVAGIYGSTISGGSAVYVNAAGELGVQSSSERYKTDIAPMPELASRLRQLRPVTFHYKMDPGTPQYGLIAEEVDKVYPELVLRDNSGEIQGVRYEQLTPMLLSELQRQQATIESQADQIKELSRRVADVDALRHELKEALQELGPGRAASP